MTEPDTAATEAAPVMEPTASSSSARPLTSQQLSEIYSLPSNRECAECSSLSPDWASVTYGIVICLECAGRHRGLGVHLSFVRSLTMDDWTEKQRCAMMRGGNGKWKDYWEAHKDAAEISLFQAKYESNAARDYREILAAESRSNAAESAESGSALPQIEEPSLSPRPSIVSLPTEPPPTENEAYQEVAFPFFFFLAKHTPATRRVALVWGLLGVGGAYWVRSLGVKRASESIASSLPPINTNVHDYMTGRLDPAGSSSTNAMFYNAVAALIIAITVGVPYVLLTRTARKFAKNFIVYRQDAFKSARNLLAERISMGRARRLKLCDVFYPSPTKGDNERKAKQGLIFYPGALVERTAYAPIASRLSDAGILVSVVNFEPHRLRLISPGRDKNKEEVMRIIYESLCPPPPNQTFSGTSGEFSNDGQGGGGASAGGIWQVDEWAIGGHSFGSSVAITILLEEMSSTFNKLVLWGISGYSDPTADPRYASLREIPGLDVLLVNGTNDSLVESGKKSKGAEFQAFLPPRQSTWIDATEDLILDEGSQGRTYFIDIQGGNHAGCAHYGPQKYPIPDGDRTITLEQQQRQTAEFTAEFLLTKLRSKNGH